ncbi:hypothetical protein [Sphingomonas sp. Leaf25]|uniref:hypothetical protein n=1 Tax=Sphingomonas sp. Leaf25 TaxID=1735692 RepID=UPI0006FA87E0|nr:hypothetical protein [Sphingomonas sp. Leaf25]KQM96822.1 hypothetical protein ASE78_12795 [Sphingomonas sp. Leaf25]
MIFLALLAAQAPMLRVPPAVLSDARVVGDGARLVWRPGTAIAAEARDGELVVRSDQPIDDAAIDAFRAAAGNAIGDLRWNDDSLVLRPAAGWDMTWSASGSAIAVAFAAHADDIVVDAPDQPVELDTRLLAIEADVAAGYPGQGRRAAEALAHAYPDDPRIGRIVADARNADGDLRGAAKAYRKIGATDRTARRAQAFAPGAASVGATLRSGGDLSQVESAARADVAVDDTLTLGGGVRAVASRVDTGTRRESYVDPIVDLAATARVGDATRVQAVLAGAIDSGVTGGGVRVTAGSAEAQWRAALLLHQPDYSTVEQAIGGGHLSRITAGGGYRIAPGLVGQVDVGANRYGLAGMGGASDTLTLAGGLDYIVRRGGIAFGLTYRLEGEYVQRLRRYGDGSAIVDLVNRENHTVQGLLSGAFGEAQLTGLAGWTVDRFGGNGPNASLGLNLPVATAWRIEASGGITSIARPGFPGEQVFARAQVSRGLGNGR